MKSFTLSETETTLRVILSAPGAELAPAFDAIVTIPGSSGISVETRASIRVPVESKPEVLSLLARIGFTMLVLVLLILPAKAFAFCDDWRTSDTVLAVTYTAFHVLDWQQTQERIRLGWPESNQIMGRHPSANRVDDYFTVTLLGVYLGACILPNPWRDALLAAGIVVEFNVTQSNTKLGLRATF